MKHLLDQSKKAGAPPVRQIVTDGSKALQNALSLSYNDCSFSVYLDDCHEVAKGIKSNMLPCFIRSDIAHLIKSVTRWACFAKDQENVKDFYIRIIGFLSKISNYEEFMKVVFYVFLVCQSPKVGDGTKVFSSLDELKNCIKFHSIDQCKEDCTCDYCCESTLDLIPIEDEEISKKHGKKRERKISFK